MIANKINIATDYLQKLLQNHSKSIEKLGPMMSDVNNCYEQKIKAGEYKINEDNNTLKSNSVKLLATKQLNRYRDNKRKLAEELHLYNINQDNEFLENKSNIISEEERKKFIKKMREEQIKLNLKKKKYLQQTQIKKQQKDKEQQLKKDLEEKQRQEAKRRLIQQKLEELNENKFKRQFQIHTRNKQYQSISRQKTLQQKMEQNYKKFENMSLLEKKKKLAEIRSIHKPMSKEQFQEHLQRIKEYKSMKKLQKNQSFEDQKWIPQNRYYKSHWYKQILMEQKIDFEKEQYEQKQALKQLKDREKKYAEYIRQNFVPEPDEKNIQEILKRQKDPIPRKKAKQIRQMGLSNLKYSKESVQKASSQKRLASIKEQRATVTNKPINYLQQLKKNRKSTSLHENFLQNIKKKPINEYSKMQQIKEYAEKLQQKAIKRQKLMTVKRNLVDLQADDMLINAMNLKLNYLNKK